MRKVSWATPLYKFLRYCSDSPLDKTVLDCGAGGDDPPLQQIRDELKEREEGTRELNRILRMDKKKLQQWLGSPEDEDTDNFKF